MVLPDREEELIPASVAAELREEEEESQSDPAEDLRSNTTTTTTKVTSSSARNLDANSSTSSASPAPSTSSPSPNLHTLQFINTCECCTERPADWWCPADQAYFCHSCDQSVHSANAFSSRHERERISPEASAAPDPGGYESDPAPVSGSKRKSSPNSKSSWGGAGSPHKMIRAEAELLPGDESNPEEVEEDVFQDIDLFLAEDEEKINNNSNSSSLNSNPNNSNTNTNNNISREDEEQQQQQEQQQEQQQQEQQRDGLIVPRMPDTCDNLNDLLGLSGFDPQVEEDESRFDFAIRKNNVVRLIDGPDEVDGFYTRVAKPQENHLLHQLQETPKLKLEAEEEEQEQDLSYRAEQRSVELLQSQIPLLKKSLQENPQRPWLKLDVKDVQNCWQSGLFLQDVKDAKPLAPVDSISDAAGSSDVGVVPDMSRSRKSGHCEDQAAQVPVHMSGDLDSPGGREARVSRYREKRRTRLFSKKIRYEVRKLNAERRPRLKGRFVKRSPVGGS